jgi:glycosyltransferase involved in cell wall biosynthesis
MSYAPIQSDLTLTHQTSPSNTAPALQKNFKRNHWHPPKGATRRRSTRASLPQGQTNNRPALIVHCHLCWDWVWQRPQQFISRLSREHKVLFVETVAPDPQLAAPLVRFRRLEEFPNITVLRLQFPQWKWGDGHYVDLERRRLVQEFLAGPLGQGFDAPIQWFYDPMAVRAFAGHMGEILTVYDCMDELSKFRGAPPGIIERELELLERADVVFTGGRRLFEAKSRLHHNCHFYGCGVDYQHFGQARAAQTAVPGELTSLPQPVLGYFGVIDERMDYELLSCLAKAKPHWSIVLVGPTTKVDSGMLPRWPNLHWLGQRAYAELPALCKSFEVCLMPFALNAATEFINPTKALEYMATGRPIVSTAVPDVVRNFGSVVGLARSPEEFIRLCETALDQPNAEAIARGLKMARENSWDSIVRQLEGHLQEAMQNKQIAG